MSTVDSKRQPDTMTCLPFALAWSTSAALCLHFGYEIVRADDGKMLAEGETVHVVVDSHFDRRHLPEKYLGPFMKAAGKS